MRHIDPTSGELPNLQYINTCIWNDDNQLAIVYTTEQAEDNLSFFPNGISIWNPNNTITHALTPEDKTAVYTATWDNRSIHFVGFDTGIYSSQEGMENINETFSSSQAIGMIITLWAGYLPLQAIISDGLYLLFTLLFSNYTLYDLSFFEVLSHANYIARLIDPTARLKIPKDFVFGSWSKITNLKKQPYSTQSPDNSQYTRLRYLQTSNAMMYPHVENASGLLGVHSAPRKKIYNGTQNIQYAQFSNMQKVQHLQPGQAWYAPWYDTAYTIIKKIIECRAGLPALFKISLHE